MKNLVTAARAAGVKVIYVPHHHSEEGDRNGWKFGGVSGRVFKAGNWAVEYLSLININEPTTPYPKCLTGILL